MNLLDEDATSAGDGVAQALTSAGLASAWVLAIFSPKLLSEVPTATWQAIDTFISQHINRAGTPLWAERGRALEAVQKQAAA